MVTADFSVPNFLCHFSQTRYFKRLVAIARSVLSLGPKVSPPPPQHSNRRERPDVGEARKWIRLDFAADPLDDNGKKRY